MVIFDLRFVIGIMNDRMDRTNNPSRCLPHKARLQTNQKSKIKNQKSRHGGVLIELLVAILLLVAVLLPTAFSIASEQRAARGYYQRAIAMEIVDGEMEALAAGDWRAFTPGAHPYSVQAAAATNLPPGQFLLTITTNTLRLEWQPAIRHHGGAVVREVKIK
jgi:hypothetical protein